MECNIKFGQVFVVENQMYAITHTTTAADSGNISDFRILWTLFPI